MRRTRAGDAIDIGRPPYPTDRELELAIDFARELDAAAREGDSSRASLLTEASRLLARYRLELDKRGRRDVAYSFVDSDLRSRRVEVVTMQNYVRYVEQRQDGRCVRAHGRTLVEAVDALETSERDRARTR